jgi:hypothetical protein
MHMLIALLQACCSMQSDIRWCMGSAVGQLAVGVLWCKVNYSSDWSQIGTMLLAVGCFCLAIRA